MPWSLLLKEKAKLGVEPAADPSPATNSHYDILTQFPQKMRIKMNL